jgi:hypothetical protein
MLMEGSDGHHNACSGTMRVSLAGSAFSPGWREIKFR